MYVQIVITYYILSHIHCVWKKDTKLFSVISSLKLGRFWLHFVCSFLNKFAAKWYKYFLPHLNNVPTPPCETWNAHCARASIELLWKETPEFIPPQLWPQIRLMWIQLITACEKYCKRMCTKHASPIWSDQQCHWQMAATVTTWSSLAHSLLSRSFSSSISVMHILCIFSSIVPTHCNQLDSNLAYLEATVKVG